MVRLRCASSVAELAADRLFGLGASAVGEEPDGDGTVLTADIEPEVLEDLRRWCATCEPTPEVQQVAVDPAWADSWREHATTHRVGPLLVRPPWLAEPLGSDEIELVVDPGHAFGSGSHPTTRLCLEALVGRVRGGERVLDVGCGSGVLAVAALKLGAARAVGLDIDPAAIDATREVAAVNGVQDRIEVGDGRLAAVPGTFDLVLANLLVGIIEDLGSLLVSRVAPGGTLVVSGVLESQRDRVVGALSPLEPGRERALEGWLAVEMRHPDRGSPAPPAM